MLLFDFHISVGSSFNNSEVLCPPFDFFATNMFSFLMAVTGQHFLQNYFPTKPTLPFLMTFLSFFQCLYSLRLLPLQVGGCPFTDSYMYLMSAKIMSTIKDEID